jgi:acyl carrier protein
METGMKYLQTVIESAQRLNLFAPDGKLIALDSLTLVDFVVELEKVSGITIPTSSMSEAALASVESVAELLSELE